METVKYIITHVSGQLSDQRPHKEFSRWPRDILLEYMKEGLKEIATYKPEAFMQTVEIELVAGSKQTVRVLNEGKYDVSYDANFTFEKVVSNKDGSFVSEADLSLMRAFGAYATCPATPKVDKYGKIIYSVRSYAKDDVSNNGFYVSPPVPPGLTPKVSVSVISAAFVPSLASWDQILPLSDKYYNNLIDYMMARAYQRDTESQVSQAQSQRLLSMFYQSMGTKYKFDAARGSGFYEGKVGTGDSRAIVR